MPLSGGPEKVRAQLRDSSDRELGDSTRPLMVALSPDPRQIEELIRWARRIEAHLSILTGADFSTLTVEEMD
jgi:hypothetical protein